MNPLPLLRQAELNLAVRIDDNDWTRVIARHWSHNGPRALWMLFGAFPLLPLAGNRAVFLVPFVTLLAAVHAGSRLADRTHEVGWIDQAHPCPLCPGNADGDNGHGGGGWNGDFPTAPPPMDDFDDDRIRAMAGDLDAQLAALVQEVTS